MVSSRIHRSACAALRMVLPILVAASLLAGCAPATPTPDPATATPLPPTATPQPTETPQPTSTPTLTPTPQWTATAAAKATGTAQSNLDKIRAELDPLDIELPPGELAWTESELIPLRVEDYSSYVYFPVSEDHLKDFILHTHVTWDSTSGLAGCGIIFRSDDDLDNGGRYMFRLLRLQFQPGWDMIYLKFSQIQQILTGKTLFTEDVKDEKWSTNEVTLVAQGKTFTPYLNGKKLPEQTHDKLTEGFIAYMAYQESGVTDCEFSRSWLWVNRE